MKFEATTAFARHLDRVDPLKSYRSLFHIPKVKGKPALYFTGNSLGLQPKAAKKLISEELTDWAELGVEGHLHSRRPWLYYHKFMKRALAKLVGAKPGEVVPMNQLTVNLHLMMISFYRPTKTRYKIIVESGAFPSDQYAVQSQLQLHGIPVEDGLIELKPRPGEFSLRTEDILKLIDDHKDQLALVLIGAVQYYTGQFFKIREITEAGHRAGAVVGFDLAHAIGNVPLQLHHDNVDFAVWCSYKYLNSGPGGVAGIFVHERHATNFELLRLAGWWGHNEKERFQMQKEFKPMPGADGWQLSNFPILSGAAHLASLKIFEAAGIKTLRKKSLILTSYLEFLLRNINTGKRYFSILTPTTAEDRGCQLSIMFNKDGKKIFNALTRKSVIADWREPSVIRVAPVPLYNTFEDVFTFSVILKSFLK